MHQTSTKKYKTIYNKMGKGDQLGIVQEIKFDHTTKWYIHKSVSVSGNKMHKILWDRETNK